MLKSVENSYIKFWIKRIENILFNVALKVTDESI